MGLIVRLCGSFFFIFGYLIFSALPLCGQGLATASRPAQFSVFVLGDGVFTGLGGFGAHEGLGGRNVGVTAGADYAFLIRGAYQLKAEVRGTYPVYQGHVDGQKDLLGGLRVERSLHTLPGVRVYGDVLGGRGEMKYVDGGYLTATKIYLRSSSAVYGAGGGFEIDCGRQWAFVGEGQLQRWRTPVTQDRSLLAKVGSGGITYRF